MIRLRRLNLELFGQFTDRSYDFGPRPQDGADVHIIHGSNEAGKTTTMEGFLRLLYGFPLREPYAFRHDRKTLRISGTVDLGDREIALTRLPLRSANLTDPQGQALPEHLISAQLGGLALDDYRNLLCLDDETIERGGEEIASAKGDIGRLLFSAAAGLGNLTEVLDGVGDRADALYKKRSGKTRMASLKRELDEVDSRIKAEDVSASAYRTLRQTHGRATEDEARAIKARAGHARTHATARARRDALPLLADIDGYETLIQAHPDLPRRPDVDPETLVDMLTAQKQAQTDQARLDDEIAALTATRDAIQRDAPGLTLAEALDGLDDLRSRFANAKTDLPKRHSAVDDIRAQMRAVALDLGVDHATDPAALILTPAELAQLEALRETLRDTGNAARTEAGELAALTDRIDRAKGRLATFAPVDGTLGALLDRYAADTLATRHATATQALGDARRQADEARDDLTIGAQGFATLPDCAISADATRALADTHAQIAADLRSVGAEIQSLDTQIAEAEARIAALTQTDGFIDDTAARALLDQRNALWQAHRETLAADTAAPFETAMHAVDSAAAARLAGARDLGQLRQLEQDTAVLQTRRAAKAAAQAELTAHQAATEQSVADIAAQAGIVAPPSPAALADWADRLARAQAARRRQDRLQQDHAETFAQATRLAEALHPLLDLEHPDFDTLIAAARRRAAEDRKAQEARGAAQAQYDDLLADKAARQARQAKTAADAQTAAQAWDDAVATATPVSPEIVQASLAPLRDLRELDTRRTAIARQIASMEADQQAFIQALAGIAPPKDDEPPLDTFARLRQRAKAAQQAEETFAETSAAIARLTGQRDKAEQTLTQIADKTGELARAFPGTTTLPELRHAVNLTQQVNEARALRDAARSKLCTMLDADTLDAARATLAGQSAAELDAQLLQIDADTPRIEAEYSAAIAARSAAARDLAAITGDADIAALNERKTTIALEMQDTALDYLKLRFGHSLAEEAIRRYRDAHRSGMMHATETAFGDLTGGAYTRLLTRPEGARETLIALDPAGQSKRAEDMSKGTRFQLYLALRAAAYAQLAQQGTILPFFCDDIFETFDEDRTRAACRLLARIGRSGQAIYLTHHAHVVDIARDVCGDDLRVHRL